MFRCSLRVSISPTRESDPPDAPRAVIAYVERAISAHRYTDWSSPNFSVFGDEASEEVFVASVCCVPATHRDTNDLVTSPLSAIPRAVLRGKRIAVKPVGKVASRGVKQHLQRSHMRLYENIRNDDTRADVFALATFGLR